MNRINQNFIRDAEWRETRSSTKKEQENKEEIIQVSVEKLQVISRQKNQQEKKSKQSDLFSQFANLFTAKPNTNKADREKLKARVSQASNSAKAQTSNNFKATQARASYQSNNGRTWVQNYLHNRSHDPQTLAFA